MTTPQKIDALENDKARLEAQIAVGGEYIDDRYGDAEWLDYTPFQLAVMAGVLNQMQKDLIALYKSETFIYV